MPGGALLNQIYTAGIHWLEDFTLETIQSYI